MQVWLNQGGEILPTCWRKLRSERHQVRLTDEGRRLVLEDFSEQDDPSESSGIAGLVSGCGVPSTAPFMVPLAPRSTTSRIDEGELRERANTTEI